MQLQTLDALAHRIERLERECRLWRRVGGSAFLVAIALVVSGAATRSTNEVELERLVIKSKQDGAATITLSAVDGHPSLSFANEGREKISLTIPKDGSPTFSLVEAGKGGLMFGLSRNGAPVLNFYDENQRRRISLGIFPKVGPMMSVLDENNRIISKSP
jgi:hypothetical protein